MSEFVSEKLDKIQTHLDYGELELANHLVREIEYSHTISDLEQLKIDIYKAQLFLEQKEPTLAQAIIVKRVNEIANWPKSEQLHILYVASELSAYNKDYRMLEVYTNKFMNIYSSISPILQEKTRAFYADMQNFVAQLSVINQNYIDALDNYEKVIPIQRKLNRPFQQAVTLYNAGKTANLIQRVNRAEVFLEEAYRIFKDLKHVEGQYVVAQAFTDTYAYKGDNTSVITFQNIANQLEQELKVDQIRKEKSFETKNLEQRNSELLQKIHKLTRENQKLELNEKNLLEGIDHLQSKLEDYQQLKAMFSSMQDKINQLEDHLVKKRKEITTQTEIIDQQQELINTLKTQIDQQSKLPEGVMTSNTELDEVLSSSRLIYNIFYKLQETKSIKIRLLAMQLRISTQKCQEAIKELEELTVVEIDSWNFASPQVTLNSRYLNYSS